MESARITMYGRPGCHLCDYAREALERVRASTGVSWTEINVESDPELERDYGGRVPVIMLDGREHCWFRVEEDRLLRDLATGPPERPIPSGPSRAAHPSGPSRAVAE